MATNAINILCPSGHRHKVQMMSNTNLLQVLEDICNEEGLDSSEWGLNHQRSKCDLTIPWHLQRIPANAVLEMYKLENRRQTDDIHVHLQLPDNSRYSGWFEPTVTLQEMLDWYRIQPESMVAALDISLAGNNNSCPVCSYMSNEIIGEYALSNTILREIGLTKGTAVIRYNLRPVTDSQLQIINGRIDEKISRRRQQQYEREQKSKQSHQQQQRQQPTKSEPIHSSPSSTSNSSCTPINSNVSRSNNEEYSIFRDPPSSALLPSTATSQRQSKTLAEELRINISLELEPDLKHQRQSEVDFQNFKFPRSTEGKELNRNETNDDYQYTQNVKPCDRHPIAYDVTKSESKRETRNNKSETVPDSFYELTSDDLRSVLNDLQEQISYENPLETRAMRHKRQSERTMNYEQVAIRFVVNAKYILQGLFRPEEPVSHLIEFARASLVCSHLNQPEFYLYKSPPRVILSDLQKSLSTYDLAPATFIHLGHRTVSPLVVKLASNIPIGSIYEANQLTAKYVFSRARPMSECQRNALCNARSPSATSLISRPIARNATTRNVDDKLLREKFRKFLPGNK